MSIYLGNIEPKKYFVGDKEAKSVWIGGTKVWEKSAGNVVHIGENDYPFVQIGSLLWTTENLHEPLGTLNYHYKKTYIGDEVWKGYHYRWSAICKENDTTSDFLNQIIPNGWRVPKESDYQKIVNAIGGVQNAAKLKSESGWNANNGTNETRFNAFPVGWYHEELKETSSIEGVGSWYQMWLSNIGNVLRLLSNGNNVFEDRWNDYYGMSVRLCKDA